MAYGSPAYVVDKVNGKMQNFVQYGIWHVMPSLGFEL